MVETKQELIRLLLDKSAEESERDDAAIDLGDYDDDEVISTLVSVAADPTTEEVICSSCGESLGAIWLRKGSVDQTFLNRIRPEAQREAIALIKSRSTASE